jgi:hypothetical protein
MRALRDRAARRAPQAALPARAPSAAAKTPTAKPSTQRTPRADRYEKSPLAPFTDRADYRALPAATRRAIEALFDCTENPRSQRARALLSTATLASHIGWEKLLTDLSISVDVLKREAAFPDMPDVNAIALSRPTRVATHHFNDAAPGPALRCDCRVAGKTIPIFARREEEAKIIADCLRAVPKQVIALLDRVDISGTASTVDDYWAKQYGVPVKAAMSNSSRGILNVYPEAWKQDRQTLVRNILHEVGHTWSLRLFGEHEHDPGWQRWKDAMQEDAMAPSYYGGVSPYEDAAESYLLYFLRPLVAEHAHMMPARFRLMRELMGGSPSAR